jgi:heterodisulfide reductase subunit D
MDAPTTDRPDIYQRLTIMQDVDQILTEAADLGAINGLDLDETRDVILRDIRGEQPLPRRAGTTTV